jgi:thymidylate kinase
MGRPRTSPYFLIEGVDLSGKSSVLKALNKGTYQNRHSSLLGRNKVLEVAREAHKDGSEWIGHLYVQALEYDLQHFRWPTKPTIQDSTILLRSLAYHIVAGYDLVVNKLTRLAVSHPRFTAAYVLTATMDARKERLQARMQEGVKKVTPNDLKILTDPKFFCEMERCLIEQAQTLFNAAVIDTTHIPVEEVVKRLGL